MQKPERGREQPTQPTDAPKERPAYEPPRIQKKRTLSRATLFTGQGPEGGPGLMGDG